MAKISDVIERLQQIQAEHGDLEVQTVPLHSDGWGEFIEDIDVAVTVEIEKGYVLIGGESY